MILTEVGTVSKDCFYNRKWSRNRLQTRRQYKERLTRYNSDSDKFLARRNKIGPLIGGITYLQCGPETFVENVPAKTKTITFCNCKLEKDMGRANLDW